MNDDVIVISPELYEKVKVWRDITREMRDEDLENVLLKLVKLEIKQRAEFNQKFQVELDRREEVTNEV